MLEFLRNSRKNPSPWLIALLTLGVVGIGAGTTLRTRHGSGAARAGLAAGRASAPAGTLFHQFQEDLDRVFADRNRSASLSDWEKGGFLPADVVLEAIALRDPTAGAELCRALLELAAPELVAFEQTLSAPATSRFLPCFPELRTRIEAHWDSQRSRIAAALASLPQAPLQTLAIALASKEGSVISGEEFPAGQLALVFEGGPDLARTPQLLQLLKEARAPATFLMSGAQAQKNSALAQLVHHEGFAVGTVGWSNRPMPNLSVKDADQELERGRSGVASASGARVRLFRFPLGESSEFYQNFVAQKKLITLVGSLPADDWKLTDPTVLLSQILEGVDRQKGGILVLRDSLTQNEIILPLLLRELAARRIRLVSFQ